MKKTIKQSLMSLILSIGLFVFVALTLVMFLVSSYANDQLIAVQNYYTTLTMQADLLNKTSDFLAKEIRAYAATGDVSHKDAYYNEINNDKNREKAIETLVKNNITADEKAIIDQMMAVSNSLIPLEEKAMLFADSFDFDQATVVVYGDEYEKGMEKVDALNQEFVVAIQQRTADEYAKAQHLDDTVAVVAIISVVIVMAISGVYGFYVLLKVISPIKKLSVEMGEISKGNFSSDFNLEPDTSEIGQLINGILISRRELRAIIADTARVCGDMARGDFSTHTEANYVGEFEGIHTALKEIRTSLSDMVSHINDASIQVSSGAVQISGASQSMAAGATEQASSIEELSATVQEVASQVRANALHANDAKLLSRETGEEVEKGNNHMNEMLAAITGISDSYSDIAKIIKVIDDIAFQTNILALNAAVEAATAGDAGKGFAVVAAEVRTLAGRSAEAARQTAELIESSGETVVIGENTAKQTAESFVHIEEKARETMALVEGIATASDEQSLSIEEITLGLSQISTVVQTNAATAEESSAASEELSAQATMLQEEIAKFKLT